MALQKPQFLQELKADFAKYGCHGEWVDRIWKTAGPLCHQLSHILLPS